MSFKSTFQALIDSTISKLDFISTQGSHLLTFSLMNPNRSGSKSRSHSPRAQTLVPYHTVSQTFGISGLVL